MTTLTTQLNPRSHAFTDNAEHMQSMVDELKSLIEHIKLGGGERYQARHQARGKLLPRERIDLLIDPGSPLSGIFPARRTQHVRQRRCPRCGYHYRNWPG